MRKKTRFDPLGSIWRLLFCITKLYSVVSKHCGVFAGAPLVVTEDLIKTFNISLVIRGTVAESQHQDKQREDERYAYPVSKEIFR